MNKLLHLILIVSLSFGIPFSCTKIDVDPNKRKSTELLQDIAIPIITGDFGIEEILRSDTNSYAHFDENGQIWLTYTSKLKSLKASKFTINKNTSFTVYRSITNQEKNASFNSTRVNLNVNRDFNFDFKSPNNVSPIINSVHVKEGKLDIGLANSTGFANKLTISIPGMTKNGTYYRETVELKPFENKVTSLDISDYIIKLENSSFKKNALNVSLSATVTKGKSLYLQGSVSANLNFNNETTYKVVYGDFLRQNLLEQSNSTIDFKLVKGDKGNSSLKFDDFKLGLRWDNSFGIPVEMDIKSITGSNNKGSIFQLDVNNINQNELLFNAPRRLGDITDGILLLDKSNTVTGGGKLNSKDFMNEQPSSLSFTAFATTNPVKYNYPSFKNFIGEKSEFNLALETAFLLKGSVKDYKFEEIVEMNMGEDVSRVKMATLKMHSINGFPLEFMSKFEFLDAQNKVLFTLNENDELLLKSGIVNASGHVIATTTENTEIDLNEEQVALLPKVKRVAVVASFSTTNNGNKTVQINKSNSLILKLGLRVKYLNEIKF